MIRTQIQLPDQIHAAAKSLADAREISLTEIVRRALEDYLAKYPSPPKPGGWQLPKGAPLGLRPDADLENLRYDQEFRHPYVGFNEK